MKKKKSGIVASSLQPDLSEIETVLNELPEGARFKIMNGLTEAVMGFNPGGGGDPLSQVTSIFRNLRKYLVSNMRQPLSQAYVELGVVKTICDVPVDDGMRGGFEFKSKELSPEEVEELQFTMEQENDLGKMASALKWNRLFGGAGVIIVTNQDPMTELDIESIKEGDPVLFKSCDMWELYWDEQNTERETVTVDERPLDDPKKDFYRYYGRQIHKSRVMVMKGIEAPSFVRPRLRGWGLSVVETLVRSVNQYLKANDLTYEVLDEFKVDVYKIKNLTGTLLSPNGSQTVTERIRLANYQKNYQNAITMDSEDDFAQKELSFQGLAETMTGIRMQVASDLRMPLTKIFGISATGFNSGEDDIENYNAMVESTIRTPSKHHIITMGKLRCQQLFGYVPDDLTGDFKPLRMLSSEQEENVKNAKFARLFQCVSAGQMTTKEFKDACNKDKLLGIQLDTTIDTIDVMGDADGEDGAGTEGESEAEAPKFKAKKPATQTPEAKS